VAEESANTLVQFRADDVFKFAGLRVRFVVLDAERVFEQAFRKAMAANNVSRPALPPFCQQNFVIFLYLYEA